MQRHLSRLLHELLDIWRLSRRMPLRGDFLNPPHSARRREQRGPEWCAVLYRHFSHQIWNQVFCGDRYHLSKSSYIALRVVQASGDGGGGDGDFDGR